MKKTLYFTGLSSLLFLGMYLYSCNKTISSNESKFESNLESFMGSQNQKSSSNIEFYKTELDKIEAAMRIFLEDPMFKSYLIGKLNSTSGTRDNYLNMDEILGDKIEYMISMIRQNVSDLNLQNELINSFSGKGLRTKSVSWSLYVPYYDLIENFHGDISTCTRTISGDDVYARKLNQSNLFYVSENFAQSNTVVMLCINGISDADDAGVTSSGITNMPWHRCSCGRLQTGSNGSCKEAYGVGCNGSCGRANFRGACPGTLCATC